ncbi:hypothetical protein ES708_27782 [subsurface metagenome]
MKSGFGEAYLKSQIVISRPYLDIEMSGQTQALAKLEVTIRRILKELRHGI